MEVFNLSATLLEVHVSLRHFLFQLWHSLVSLPYFQSCFLCIFDVDVVQVSCRNEDVH